MNQLIIFCPPRPLDSPSAEWQLPALWTVMIDDRRSRPHVARTPVDQLARADEVILVLDARDVTLIKAVVPPLSDARLRLALPNLIEDRILGDVQKSHMAVDRRKDAAGEQRIAVVDRAWFAFLFERLGPLGQRTVKAVPMSLCLPNSNGPVVAGVPALSQAAQSEPTYEWVVREGDIGYGLSVAMEDRSTSLSTILQSLADTMAGDVTTLTLELPEGAGVDWPAVSETVLGMPTMWGRAAEAAQPVSLVELATQAAAVDFNICQFEFGAGSLARRGALVRWRAAIAFTAAAVVAALIGLNVHAFILQRQHDALMAQMTALVKTTFPQVGLVVDPPLQMAQQLSRAKAASGALAPDDFLAQVEMLARAMPPAVPDSIAKIDYVDRAMTVRFKNGTDVSGINQRLSAQGAPGVVNGQTLTLGRAP